MATSWHMLAPPPAPQNTRRGTLGVPPGSPPAPHSPSRGGSGWGSQPAQRDDAVVLGSRTGGDVRGDSVGRDSPQHPQRRAPQGHPGVAAGVTGQPCMCHGHGMSRPGDVGCRLPGARPGTVLPVIILTAADIFGLGAADGWILSLVARRVCGVCHNSTQAPAGPAGPGGVQVLPEAGTGRYGHDR